jgi:hypothetical protein
MTKNEFRSLIILPVLAAVLAIPAMPNTARGQGTVLFGNRFPGISISHVYFPSTNDESFHLTGNWTNDLPGGTVNYPLYGMNPIGASGVSTFVAQLLASPGSNASPASLVPVNPTSTFRTGGAAGNLVTVTATLSGVPADAPVATMAMVVWDNSSGLYPTWTQASSAWNQGIILAVMTPAYNVYKIGGVTNVPPPAITNIASFNMAFWDTYYPNNPSFGIPPQTQTVNSGQPVQFLITAFGNPSPHYQWRHSGIDIPGATSTNLMISNVQPFHAGQYTVVATNINGSTTSAPGTLTVIGPPAYTLNTATTGGGAILLSTNGPYQSNSVVTATAIASNGWTFLNWIGDASGSSLSIPVTMTRNKNLRANFGTAFNTSVSGAGSVSVSPNAPFYPYGSIVRVSALPASGSYFSFWGNAASGNLNPLYFSITNANPSISATFASLNANSYSLTALPDGLGTVTASPQANAYSGGSSVSVTAAPDPGQIFLGWSGDASGASNPLNFVINENRTITATFSRRPKLVLDAGSFDGLHEDGFRFTVAGEAGATDQIQSSTNLMDWTSIFAITNTLGMIQVTDPRATNKTATFYRIAP